MASASGAASIVPWGQHQLSSSCVTSSLTFNHLKSQPFLGLDSVERTSSPPLQCWHPLLDGIPMSALAVTHTHTHSTQASCRPPDPDMLPGELHRCCSQNHTVFSPAIFIIFPPPLLLLSAILSLLFVLSSLFSQALARMPQQCLLHRGAGWCPSELV